MCIRDRLYGKEHYLIDNAIKLFRESLNESMIDFNLETIDGKETTLDQLLSLIHIYCNQI